MLQYHFITFLSFPLNDKNQFYSQKELFGLEQWSVLILLLTFKSVTWYDNKKDCLGQGYKKHGKNG